MMLKLCYKKFHEWQYTEFSILNQHIKQILKQTLIVKKIYINKFNGYIN